MSNTFEKKITESQNNNEKKIRGKRIIKITGECSMKSRNLFSIYSDERYIYGESE